MPVATIKSRNVKTICCSDFSLKASAFDGTNYRSAGAPANGTLNADTPKGVLGGSVATIGAADWESDVGKHNSGMLLGLFANNSEGGAYENAPAAASGVVPIFMGIGLFDTFIFETNAALTAFASILANYTLGAKLYASPFGLLTPELPTDVDGVPADGVVTVVGYVTAVPTSALLRLGLKLIL